LCQRTNAIIIYSYQQIEEGKVGQALIIAAHDYASREYLTQGAAELKNLLQLSDDLQENQVRVEALVQTFAGMSTPFKFDDCLSEVAKKMRDSYGTDKERVRQALIQMKRVGIFEDRPGYGAGGGRGVSSKTRSA
jgi:DNA invertase Pin-like site-specific DNA recombinase